MSDRTCFLCEGPCSKSVRASAKWFTIMHGEGTWWMVLCGSCVRRNWMSAERSLGDSDDADWAKTLTKRDVKWKLAVIRKSSLKWKVMLEETDIVLRGTYHAGSDFDATAEVNMGESGDDSS